MAAVKSKQKSVQCLETVNAVLVASQEVETLTVLIQLKEGTFNSIQEFFLNLFFSSRHVVYYYVSPCLLGQSNVSLYLFNDRTLAFL